MRPLQDPADRHPFHGTTRKAYALAVEGLTERAEWILEDEPEATDEAIAARLVEHHVAEVIEGEDRANLLDLDAGDWRDAAAEAARAVRASR